MDPGQKRGGMTPGRFAQRAVVFLLRKKKGYVVFCFTKNKDRFELSKLIMYLFFD